MWRKLVYSLIVFVAFFGLVEGALMLVGVRPLADDHDPLVGFSGYAPVFIEQADADGVRWLQTAPGKLRWFNQQRFLARKPANTCRIFCLGGSTTQGQPYDDRVAFSGWLRELLPAVDPATNWEVINAGGISYASYRVALVMQELARYEPDLFIVYTGHNEFLEDRTYAALRSTPDWWQAAVGWAAQTRTAAVARRLVSAAHPAIEQPDRRDVLPAEVDAALDRTIGPETYHRDDAQRQQVLKHFEVNLNRMVDIGRRCGAEVILVVPAASLKDCSPFKSQHRERLSDVQQRQWAWLFDRGNELFADDRFDEAADLYGQALRIDPRHAELHYRLGKTLFAQGRYDEAQAALRRAVDEDVCPLRAVSEIPELVMRVARARAAPLVDFRALVEQACRQQYGHAVPGGEFFLDHVHPTIAGHRLLALALVEQLVVQGVVSPITDWQATAVPQATARVESRLGERDHAVALRNLAKVLAWAGRHEEAGRLILQALQVLPDDAETHYLAGCYFKHRGNPRRAVEHFRLALPARADDGEAHRLLAGSLAECEQWADALAHFEEARRRLPGDPTLDAQYAAVLAQLDRPDEAIQYFRRALQQRGDDADWHYNLGLLLAGQQQVEAARHHLTVAARLRPNDAAIRRQLEALGAP